MSRFAYICSSGIEIELDGPITFAGTALGIRGSKTTYTLGYRSVQSFSRPARSGTVDATFTDLSEADRLVRLMDADIATKTPGTFVADGWEQRGYIACLNPTDLTPQMLTAQLECLLLDGVWMKPKLMHLFPSSGDATGTKRYAYKYPYRYASEYGVRAITVDSLTPAAFKMCIFGYVRNPIIRIADNVYRFDITVPQGGYLIVDSRDSTATLVGRNGEKTNAYSSCERGTGEGCGTYAWQRIPSGTSFAYWNDTFGFDLTVFEEISAPPIGGT